MKRISLIILIIVIVLILINFGPVWFQRLFGYGIRVEKIFYPQWINNDEYCYLKVVNYYDYDIFSWSNIPFPQNLNPFVYLSFRSPNATFYVYKVNINQPNKKILIRKITEKVNFSIRDFWERIYEGKEFTFRRLDNGELVLLIRGRSLKYIVYHIDVDGKIIKKQIFNYNYIHGKDVIDISPDGRNLLIADISELYIKDVRTGQRELFVVNSKNDWSGFNKFITGSKLIYYDPHVEKKSLDIFIADVEKKNIELVISQQFSDYDKEVATLLLDAVFLPKDKLLFLSKIGIFQKQDGNWRMQKELKDMDFNFFYPDWSPDGKRLVGVLDSKNLKVIELKDFLEN